MDTDLLLAMWRIPVGMAAMAAFGFGGAIPLTLLLTGVLTGVWWFALLPFLAIGVLGAYCSFRALGWVMDVG